MRRFVALSAMATLTTSPAAARIRDAALYSSADRAQVQPSMFVGATYRVGLDRKTNAPRGRASFKMSGMLHAPGTSELRFGEGIEIAGGNTGRPALHLAGRDVGQLKVKAQLNGTSTALIIGGVILIGVAALVVVNEVNKCEEDCDPAPPN